MAVPNIAETSDTISFAPDFPYARNGIAIIRLTIGAMFVSSFFENRGKGLYTPAGYSRIINGYIQHGHAPAAWRAVMAIVSSHAAIAIHIQATTEISLGILPVVGLLTRPVAFISFLYLGCCLISEWGTAWIWGLLVPILISFGLAVARAGRSWGADALLAQRWPSSPLW